MDQAWWFNTYSYTPKPKVIEVDEIDPSQINMSEKESIKELMEEGEKEEEGKKEEPVEKEDVCWESYGNLVCMIIQKHYKKYQDSDGKKGNHVKIGDGLCIDFEEMIEYESANKQN